LTGNSVALSYDGDKLLIGQPYNTPANNPLLSQSGAMLAYSRISSQWTLIDTFRACDASINDNLGISVGISADGTTLITGSPNDNIGSTIGKGSAYIW
jgi:hypothetical protein